VPVFVFHFLDGQVYIAGQIPAGIKSRSVVALPDPCIPLPLVAETHVPIAPLAGAEFAVAVVVAVATGVFFRCLLSGSFGWCGLPASGVSRALVVNGSGETRFSLFGNNITSKLPLLKLSRRIKCNFVLFCIFCIICTIIIPLSYLNNQIAQDSTMASSRGSCGMGEYFIFSWADKNISMIFFDFCLP